MRLGHVRSIFLSYYEGHKLILVNFLMNDKVKYIYLSNTREDVFEFFQVTFVDDMPCSIVILNPMHQCQVDPDTRKGAEVDYLKKFGKDWKNSGGSQDPEKNNPSHEFLLDHPRYPDLLASECP